MEIIMKTDLEKSIPAVIEFNFEDIKTELSAKLEEYEALVVTDESIKSAKADKAKLNKLSTALNDFRIDQERIYTAPFKAYKAKVDELIALIKSPVASIEKQLNVFDDARKQEKLDSITQFYTTNIGVLADILPMEKVLNPKWTNATVALLTVTQEMIDKIITVRNDLKIIEAMHLDCEMQMKDTYLRNFNMSEALAEKARFEEQQKKLAEIKQTEQAVETVRVEKSFTPPTVVVEAVTTSELKDITVTFVDTTPAFRVEMSELIKKHNIVCR